MFDVALQLVATILFQTFAAGNSLFGDGTSVVEMNALLESRFATTNSTTLAEWERSLPSESEKNEIRKVRGRLENKPKVPKLIKSAFSQRIISVSS